ncbi:MAG: glutathione synthase [Burkholderiaceae bacterium]
MDILFIADPLASFNLKKDSTYAMMAEAGARGHQLFACEPRHLSAVPGGAIHARAQAITLTGSKPAWFAVQSEAVKPLAQFDAVIMRKDPPFDLEYFYASHLLERAQVQGAHVFNSGAALRNHPEKLAILEFPQFTAPTLVARDMATLKAFHAEHGDVVYKPLDGMGGTGVFRCAAGERNLNVILETLTHSGAQTIMAQKFVPAITDGDKRILIIDGVPVDWCLARIPKEGETRGNLAAGGTGVARPLTARDREIASALGEVLAKRGLLLAGIDVIGDYLTEINITSPTCVVEITEQSGINVAGLFLDAIERHAQH